MIEKEPPICRLPIPLKGETILTQVRLWRTSIQVSSPFSLANEIVITAGGGIGGRLANCGRLKTTTICNKLQPREAMDETFRAKGVLISLPGDNKPQDGVLKTKNSLISVKKTNKLTVGSRTVAVSGRYQNGGIVTEDQGFNTTAGLAVPIGQQLMCMSFHNMLFLKPLP